MQVTPYLTYSGQCEEAFKFYEQCLGGKIIMMLTHGEAPSADQIAPDWHKAIMHARLELGDQAIMGSDSPPEYQEEKKGFYVSLSIDKPEEAERIYNALAENAKINLPLQPTFWAYRFAMLVDRFGTPWMINCEKEA
ncbi:MAG TPA: VOC family protein [Thermoanaerobaculia bacterium]|nr:VOC family protein [Thermoanaerobaculia bacterium]